jgi:hypothetical protein
MPNKIIPWYDLIGAYTQVPSGLWAEKLDGAETTAQAAQSGFEGRFGGAHPLTHVGTAALGGFLQLGFLFLLARQGALAQSILRFW